jgi:LPS export ABC transporter protein LptC
MSTLTTRKKLKVALFGFLVVTLILGGMVFMQRHYTTETGIKVPLPQSATKAILALTGVHQTATRNGTVEWELTAESAELESKSGRMTLNAPQVIFFLEDGRQVRLTAEHGVLDTQSNDMHVEGNVRVVEDRYTLLTEHLNYRHAERILSSEKPVHIFSQSADLRATGMTYDLNTNQARFAGRVNGSLSEQLPL